VAQYDTPLQLTTPHMTGQKVKDAQWLMSGHAKISGLATYKDGAIDGDYGELSAQATYRAKYWCGYATRSIDRSFGQTLYELLNGARKLTPEQARLREQRLKEVAVTNPGAAALKQAITQLGQTESPAGSNKQRYGVWYQMNAVPWCCIFCSWAFGTTGYKTFRYSYVPFVHADGSANRNKLQIVRTPRPGDAVCFTFDGARDCHIEFFEKWISQGSTFSAVGGNTGPANWSNGGAVARSTRYASNVSAFVRAT
jgi:hypothetical protein